MKFAGLMLLFSIELFTIRAFSAIETVTLSSQDTFPAPRWMYGVGEIPTGNEKDSAVMLAHVKQAQISNDFSVCVERARAARSKAKALQAWLSVVELECAAKLKPSLKSGVVLARAVDEASTHADWFLFGAQVPRLKSAFAFGLLTLIDEDLKVNRLRAWKSIERIDEFSAVLDDKTKAQSWKVAGDLSMTQLKADAARDYYTRSLSLSADAEIREKLIIAERALGLTVKPNSSVNTSETVSEASGEETDLAERATIALKSGDIVVAMELATDLIRKFPGGGRAKWASDRVQDTLSSFADKSDAKYQDVHDQILQRIENVDADRLSEWARVCYNRAQFAEAYRLSKKALASIDGVRRTKTLELVSQSALAIENWPQARESFQELIDKSAGLPQARDALFRLGLLNYREKRYNDAITNFEKLLALPQAGNLELGSRYWLWRSLQRTDADRAARVAAELMAKFPFSYYGLRARLDLGSGSLEWKPAASAGDKLEAKVESVMRLTPIDKARWEKAQILVKAGWLDEAQSEMRELPPPTTASDKAVRALWWASAGGTVTASRLINEAWDENSEFRRAPFMSAVFPHEFNEFIEASAKKRSLDRDLVRGLIKQESSYNPKAISSSNAYGLMQMIPPTAKEIAQDLRLGTLKLPDDLFVPKRNIEMGTYYLSRQLSHYGGSVPLALASYNAGPGRIDRWLRTRASLKSLTSTKSSAVDDEVWFDEIPYSETCFYVKAILRNIILYRILDQGRVQMPDPIWSNEH